MPFTIWKSQLEIKDRQDIAVPKGTVFLTAREQHGSPCVWFRCDPTAGQEIKTILMIGTGHPAPENEAFYLGSCHLQNGDLVFHIFLKHEG